MKLETQTYELWTYDVWGNAKDGWEVNNRYKHGTITLKVKPTVFNQGTPHEFTAYGPTDLQINRAVRGRGIVWDGETDYTLYGETKSGKPVCELVRVK